MELQCNQVDDWLGAPPEIPVIFGAYVYGVYGVETLDGEDLGRRFTLKLRERREEKRRDRVFSQSGLGTWLRWLVYRTLLLGSYRFIQTQKRTQPYGVRGWVIGSL